MKIEYPDGSSVEFGSSGCCCPPGERKGGQHTNCGTNWYRVNGGEWVIHSRISHHRILAQCALNAEDFLEALKDR